MPDERVTNPLEKSEFRKGLEETYGKIKTELANIEAGRFGEVEFHEQRTKKGAFKKLFEKIPLPIRERSPSENVAFRVSNENEFAKAAVEAWILQVALTNLATEKAAAADNAKQALSESIKEAKKEQVRLALNMFYLRLNHGLNQTTRGPIERFQYDDGAGLEPDAAAGADAPAETQYTIDFSQKRSFKASDYDVDAPKMTVFHDQKTGKNTYRAKGGTPEKRAQYVISMLITENGFTKPDGSARTIYVDARNAKKFSAYVIEIMAWNQFMDSIDPNLPKIMYEKSSNSQGISNNEIEQLVAASNAQVSARAQELGNQYKGYVADAACAVYKAKTGANVGPDQRDAVINGTQASLTFTGRNDADDADEPNQALAKFAANAVKKLRPQQEI